MQTYTCKVKAMKAAAKRSLFAKLNGKFSQFDAIEKSGLFYVVKAGQYPERPFTIIMQYCEGYSQ